MKILNTIGKNFSVEAKDLLSSIGFVEYRNFDQEKLDECISGYEVIIVGLGLTLYEETLINAKKLKFIVTATTGLDHIDIAYANKNNIKVLSLKGEIDFLNTITGTAELAFGLIIDISRKITESAISVKKHFWDRDKFRGSSLRGKTLGIVGFGRLGKMVAKFGNGFGMKVIAHDPYCNKDEFSSFLASESRFDEILKYSDVISIHVHLSEETENMFNSSAFGMMKGTAYLVNTSRGKIVNEADVLTALKNKKIAGYATDVLADELSFVDNKIADHPLVEYAISNDNLLIVPHIGGMTHESRVATDIFITKKLLAEIT